MAITTNEAIVGIENRQCNTVMEIERKRTKWKCLQLSVCKQITTKQIVDLDEEIGSPEKSIETCSSEVNGYFFLPAFFKMKTLNKVCTTMSLRFSEKWSTHFPKHWVRMILKSLSLNNYLRMDFWLALVHCQRHVRQSYMIAHKFLVFGRDKKFPVSYDNVLFSNNRAPITCTKRELCAFRTGWSHMIKNKSSLQNSCDIGLLRDLIKRLKLSI